MAEEKCINCRRCLNRCRRNVFDTVNDEIRLHVIVKHPDRCTACGNCIAVCKYDALSMVERTHNGQQFEAPSSMEKLKEALSWLLSK